jgi:hypothetical protein
LKRIASTLIATLTIVIGTLAVGVGPASAEATGNVTVGSGTYLRGQFRQNINGSGYYFKTMGTTACTATTGDIETQIADMANYGWDNAASWAQDYNSCDTKIFRYAGPSTPLTGWVNYGSTGYTLDGPNNNLTSAFQLT